MGKAVSRPIIDYHSAVHRLGTTEVLKIEEGFDRLGVRGELRRSEFRTGFLNSVVGTPVPEELAEALFNSFDPGATGKVTVQQFVCGLAVLRHGTPEEKLRLLFAVYDADRDQRLSDRDLKRFAQALGENRTATRERAVQDALQSLNAAGPSVNFKRFSEWAKEHIDSPLVAWLYDIEQRLAEEFVEPGFRTKLRRSTASLPTGSEDSPEYSNALSRGGSLASCTPHLHPHRAATLRSSTEESELCRCLAREVGVEDDELVDELRSVWRTIVKESRFGVLDLETFDKALPSLPNELRCKLFHSLDLSTSGTLSISQWVQGLATSLAGSRPAKRHLCFKLFTMSPTTASSPEQILSTSALLAFHRYALAATNSMFGELSSTVYQSADKDGGPHPKMSVPVDGVGLPSFMGAEHGPEAETLITALGRLARVDLRLTSHSATEERTIVTRLNARFDPDRPGEKGEIWYLISARWWAKWVDFTQSEVRTQELPSIDNSNLVDDYGSLRIGLNQGTDYHVVTPGARKALVAWHGSHGAALPRKVIEIEGRKELEMYPLRLHVSRTDNDGNELLQGKTLEVSCTETFGSVQEKACALHKIIGKAKMFHRSGPQMDWEEAKECEPLYVLGFIAGHSVLVRLEGRSSSPVVSGSQNPLGSADSRSSGQPVGLQNLGNTCYMNSALQCLLHSPLLPRYFLQDYLFDVNAASTWGTGGKLAVAFSELIAETNAAMERGSGVIAPRTFVRSFTELMQEFSGWTQQDAQEFLNVFLSSLSDDVNRVREKPYVELPDSEGRPDVEVAKETWAAHCRRECSAVSALFSGQLKSELRCTVCGHVSCTFDPFMSLQVPLPPQNSRWFTCTLVRTPRKGGVQHSVRFAAKVPKHGRVSDIAQVAASVSSLKSSELVVADVVDFYVSRILKPTLAVSALREDVRPTIFHVGPVTEEADAAVRRERKESKGDVETLRPAPAVCKHLSSNDGKPTSEFADTVAARQGAKGKVYSVPAGSKHNVFQEVPERSRRPSVTSEPRKRLPSGMAETTSSVSVVVHFVHRRFQIVREYFLNPYQPELFGTPLLARLPSPCQAGELYSSAWRLVRHLVPDLEMAEGSWPFSICAVKRDGTACASCSWRKGCLGCEVQSPPLDERSALHQGDFDMERQVDFTITRTFSIDWDADVMQQHYKDKIAAHVDEDESVKVALEERKKPEDLRTCLDELTKEESIGSRHCRECSKKAGEFSEAVHQKKIGIWGCPPLLLCQLNRFHSRRGCSWKLHTLVDFPAVLDLGRHVAAGPVAEAARPVFREHNSVTQRAATDEPQRALRIGQRAKASKRLAEVLGRDDLVITKISSTSTGDRVQVVLPNGTRHMCLPEQLEIISEEEDSIDDNLLHTLSRKSSAYDLYAVVNHIGGLGSGHYTAYVRRSGRWISCNDDRIMPIGQEDIVTANGYLLFYARKDVVLKDAELWNLFPKPPPGSQRADPEVIKRSRRTIASLGKQQLPDKGNAVRGVSSEAFSDATSDADDVSDLVSVTSSSYTRSGSGYQTGAATGGAPSTAGARRRLECASGHLILKRKCRVRWHQHWLRAVYCGICQERIRRDCVRWRCRFHCDYDICGGCYTRQRRDRPRTGGMRKASRDGFRDGLSVLAPIASVRSLGAALGDGVG